MGYGQDEEWGCIADENDAEEKDDRVFEMAIDAWDAYHAGRGKRPRFKKPEPVCEDEGYYD